MSCKPSGIVVGGQVNKRNKNTAASPLTCVTRVEQAVDSVFELYTQSLYQSASSALYLSDKASTSVHIEWEWVDAAHAAFPSSAYSAPFHLPNNPIGDVSSRTHAFKSTAANRREKKRQNTSNRERTIKLTSISRDRKAITKNQLMRKPVTNGFPYVENHVTTNAPILSRKWWSMFSSID